MKVWFVFPVGWCPSKAVLQRDVFTQSANLRCFHVQYSHRLRNARDEACYSIVSSSSLCFFSDPYLLCVEALTPTQCCTLTLCLAASLDWLMWSAGTLCSLPSCLAFLCVCWGLNCLWVTDGHFWICHNPLKSSFLERQLLVNFFSYNIVIMCSCPPHLHTQILVTSLSPPPQK